MEAASAVRKIPLDRLSFRRLTPARPRLRGRGRRAQGEHQSPRAEAEPGRLPLVRRIRPLCRHDRRPAPKGAAGTRRRARHSDQSRGTVPRRGAGCGARNLADGKHGARRDAPGGRIRRDGGPDRCRRERRRGRQPIRRQRAASRAAPGARQGSPAPIWRASTTSASRPRHALPVSLVRTLFCQAGRSHRRIGRSVPASRSDRRGRT